MKLQATKVFRLSLFILSIILFLDGSLAAQESAKPESDKVQLQPAPSLPDIADIIPLATELNSRLSVLEKGIAVGLKVSAVEKGFAKVMANLEEDAAQIERFKAKADYRYGYLLELKQALESESESLADVRKPLKRAIQQLSASQTSWLDERKRWDSWQASFLKEGPFEEIQAAFVKAETTIDNALNLIQRHLKRLLTVQQKASTIKAKVNLLTAEIDGLMLALRGNITVKSSPPMFSKRYFAQFGSGLWYAVQRGLTEVSWPGEKYFERQRWVFLLQVLLALILSTLIFIYRKQLETSETWRFVGQRPIATGLFAGFTFLSILYEAIPATWAVVVILVIAPAFVRIVGCFLKETWQRLLAYGLMGFLVITRLFYLISLPLPLFRLYILVAAFVGIFFCLWQTVAGKRRGHSRTVIWIFRIGCLYLAVVLALEIFGASNLSEFLLMSVIRTVFALFVAWLLIYLTHGAIEWAIRSKASHIFARLQYDTDKIVQRLDLGVVVFIGVIALASILVIWRIFENPKEALQSVFAFGFTLGTQRISVGLILAAIGILYGAFFISWALQKLLTEQVLARRQADPGVRFSIARLVHYVVIFIGFLFALAALGLELTKITIIFGALGVGIGFGLQTIVNNFASGIIMLFERPVKVGDYIELNGQWAEVKKIGLRATVVQTFERSDIVVPNSNLISNQVINWTLSSRIVRLIIPVGVAYGSDIPLVLETLKACATSNPKLMKNPEPQVLFKSFGASSLDFELRIWIWNVDDRQSMNSEIHQEIDRRFREANIEIAFPQRDLHLRSVEESVHLIEAQASPDALRPDPSVIAPKDGDDEEH